MPASRWWAALADALSTALYVMPPERLAAMVEASRPLTVMVTLPDGRQRTLAA
jgi:thiamine biosynthesis lipoprotein ApbE